MYIAFFCAFYTFLRFFSFCSDGRAAARAIRSRIEPLRLAVGVPVDAMHIHTRPDGVRSWYSRSA